MDEFNQVKELLRIFIGIDPAMMRPKTVMKWVLWWQGLGLDYHFYVLDDLSERYRPNERMKKLGARINLPP